MQTLENALALTQQTSSSTDVSHAHYSTTQTRRIKLSSTEGEFKGQSESNFKFCSDL